MANTDTRPVWARALERKILQDVPEGSAVPPDVAQLVRDNEALVQQFHRHVVISPRVPGQHARYVVMKSGAYRGQVGELVATIGLAHASGYVLVLRMAGERLESFNPFELVAYVEEPRHD